MEFIMKKNIISKLALFAFLIAAFSSCTKQVSAGKVTELRYGFTTEPASLDPLSPKDTAESRSILFNVFEGLVKPDTTGMMLPCLAESWTVEEGGRIYNFTIREGVRFHDGSVLNTTDVKFSLDTALAAGFNGLNNIEEVAIIGTDQIRVTLKAADPEFLPYLTIGIVKADNPDREKNVYGTGPFFIESYTAQRNLVMKKFDDYWQRSLSPPVNIPHLNKVTIVFFANSDALMTALRGGSIDGSDATGSMAAQLDHRLFDIFNNFSAAVHLMALNNGAAPFNDARVRRAINYGVDVQGIIDSAFFGLGVPSGSPIIPGLSVYYNDSLSYPYNPETARALLEEAGFNNEKRLSFEIAVPSNYTMHVDTAQVITGQLAKIGVDATIKLVDWPTWLSDVYQGRNYMATIISVDSAVVAPKNFLLRYQSQAGGNFFNYKSDTFDALLSSILTEMDEAKRIQLYKEAQRVITEDAANVYIQDILYYRAFRSGAYSGVLSYPLYVIDFASIYGLDKN